jgi:hypothetical protein
MVTLRVHEIKEKRWNLRVPLTELTSSELGGWLAFVPCYAYFMGAVAVQYFR